MQALSWNLALNMYCQCILQVLDAYGKVSAKVTCHEHKLPICSSSLSGKGVPSPRRDDGLGQGGFHLLRPFRRLVGQPQGKDEIMITSGSCCLLAE